MGWQPIDSAPKDGRGVLMIDINAKSPETGCGYFYAGKWWALDRDENLDLLCPHWAKPTHWMQLPDAPA